MPRAASAATSIGLLRALLREASYLPDAHARAYFRRYVVNRFRAYQPARNAASSRDAAAVEQRLHRAFKRRQESIINERTRAMQRRAQKGLNYLRRANLGEAPCLQKVLLCAYGRLGRRKYALLANLLRPDVPSHPDDGPAPLQKMYYSNKRYLAFFDAPEKTTSTDYSITISDRYARLKTVLYTQSQQGVRLGPPIKSTSLKTPIYNVWQRPMPIKRARNNVRRWYAETMSRLLPPLPKDEWDSIHAMREGRKKIDFVKRRTPARPMDPCMQADPAFDRLSRAVAQAVALEKPSKADRPAGPQRPHNLTTQFMRRMYAKVLAYSCKLEWDDAHNKWVATWGSRLGALNPQLYAQPVDDRLFSGVDSRGLVTSRRPVPVPAREAKRVLYNGNEYYINDLPPDHPARKEADRLSADAFRRRLRDAQSAWR